MRQKGRTSEGRTAAAAPPALQAAESAGRPSTMTAAKLSVHWMRQGSEWPMREAVLTVSPIIVYLKLCAPTTLHRRRGVRHARERKGEAPRRTTSS